MLIIKYLPKITVKPKKNADIALATASIFNEISGKKKPKLIKDNSVLVLTCFKIPFGKLKLAQNALYQG